eukprot:8796666-Pyramimonas_sp.AAC.1
MSDVAIIGVSRIASWSQRVLPARCLANDPRQNYMRSIPIVDDGFICPVACRVPETPMGVKVSF